jgi:hypothetical protein
MFELLENVNWLRTITITRKGTESVGHQMNEHIPVDDVNK